MDNSKLELLKKLRSLTSIGYQNCKEALENTDYNLDLAIEWLRKKGGLKNQELNSEKKFGIVQIGQRGEKIVAFTIVCQTDFASLSEKFQKATQKIESILLDNFSSLYQTNSPFILPKEASNLINELSLATGEKISLDKCFLVLQNPYEKLGIYVHHNKQIGALVLTQGGEEEMAHELALQVVANRPHFLSLEKIPRNGLEKTKEKFMNEAIQENPNKPKEIIERVAQGRLQKYLQTICFLEQKNFRDPEMKIEDYLVQNKIKINDFRLLRLG